jgi:hypothetical protein
VLQGNPAMPKRSHEGGDDSPAKKQKHCRPAEKLNQGLLAPLFYLLSRGYVEPQPAGASVGVATAEILEGCVHNRPLHPAGGGASSSSASLRIANRQACIAVTTRISGWTDGVSWKRRVPFAPPIIAPRARLSTSGA